MKKTFFLVHASARSRAVTYINDAPDGYIVTVSEPTRTTNMNAAMWPILQSFADQLFWPVNGERVKLSPEEWKDVLSSAFNGEHVRLAQGLNGGVVMLGMRTSKMSKATFSAWLEFLHAVAVERGVDIA